MTLDLHRRTVLDMEISIFTCGGPQIHLKPATVTSNVFEARHFVLKFMQICKKEYYYSYGEHCWVFLQICINFNTKWRASNTFEAHSGGPQMYLRPATGKLGHLHT